MGYTITVFLKNIFKNVSIVVVVLFNVIFTQALNKKSFVHKLKNLFNVFTPKKIQNYFKTCFKILSIIKKWIIIWRTLFKIEIDWIDYKIFPIKLFKIWCKG